MKNMRATKGTIRVATFRTADRSREAPVGFDLAGTSTLTPKNGMQNKSGVGGWGAQAVNHFTQYAAVVGNMSTG